MKRRAVSVAPNVLRRARGQGETTCQRLGERLPARLAPGPDTSSSSGSRFTARGVTYREAGSGDCHPARLLSMMADCWNRSARANGQRDATSCSLEPWKLVETCYMNVTSRRVFPSTTSSSSSAPRFYSSYCLRKYGSRFNENIPVSKFRISKRTLREFFTLVFREMIDAAFIVNVIRFSGEIIIKQLSRAVKRLAAFKRRPRRIAEHRNAFKSLELHHFVTEYYRECIIAFCNREDSYFTRHRVAEGNNYLNNGVKFLEFLMLD